MYQISLITINYNSSKETIAMIKSILEKSITPLSYEIIIVDNASTDEEYNYLVTNLPTYDHLKIISSRVNVGFSSGNMLGVQEASGEYYFFLNNDTLLLNDVMNIFYQYASTYKCALVTAQLINEKGEKTVSFNYFPSLIYKIFGSGAARVLEPKRFISRRKEIVEPTEIDVASGACMFINSELFDRLGGLDTNLFLYCEEEDICKRIHDLNGDIVLLPEAKVQHFEGGSTQRDITIEKEFIISYFYLVNKHFTYVSGVLLKLFYFLKILKKALRAVDFRLVVFVLSPNKLQKSLKLKQIILKQRRCYANK
jgi:GT2 family glycosyltransferase